MTKKTSQKSKKSGIFQFPFIGGLRTFNAFHHRSFSLLFISTLTMSVGDLVMLVALQWLVLVLTDSPLSLGMLWAARLTPHFIWGMLAGVIADRVDRRKLLLWALGLLAIFASVMCTMITQGWVKLWHVLLFTFLFGSIRTFAMPARHAIIVDLVGLEDAMGAISLSQVAIFMTQILSSLVSGFVIEMGGIRATFYIVVLGYLSGFVALFFVQRVTSEVKSRLHTLRRHFFEGLGIVGRNRIVLSLVVMAIFCEVLGFSHKALLPVFARDVLGIGASGLGLLHALQSLGGLIATLTLASLGNVRWKGRLILGSFLFFGVFLVFFAQSPWYPLSLVLCSLVGATGAAFDAMQITLLQLNVTQEQRGRSMGIRQLSIGFGTIGSLSVGALAGLLGAPVAVTINGLLIVLVFIVLAVSVRKLHRV